MDIFHDATQQRFILNINVEIVSLDYAIQEPIMYLSHSKVPNYLRGQDIENVFLEKTFKKSIQEGFETVTVCSYILLKRLVVIDKRLNNRRCV